MHGIEGDSTTTVNYLPLNEDSCLHLIIISPIPYPGTLSHNMDEKRALNHIFQP